MNTQDKLAVLQTYLKQKLSVSNTVSDKTKHKFEQALKKEGIAEKNTFDADTKEYMQENTNEDLPLFLLEEPDLLDEAALDKRNQDIHDLLSFAQIPGFIPANIMAWLNQRLVPVQSPASKLEGSCPVLFEFSQDGLACIARAQLDAGQLMTALCQLDLDFSKKIENIDATPLSDVDPSLVHVTPSISVLSPSIQILSSLDISPQHLVAALTERVQQATIAIEQQGQDQCQCLVQIRGLGAIQLAVMRQSDSLTIEMRVQNPSVAALLVREMPALLTNLCQSKTLADRYKMLKVRMKALSEDEDDAVSHKKE